MKLEITPDIRLALERVNIMRVHEGMIFAKRWRWQRGFSMNELIAFWREIADARTSLFVACEKRYPQLRRTPYSLNGSAIIVDVDEPSTTDAAGAGELR